HVYRVYGLGPPPTYPIPGESCRIHPYHPASRKAAEAYADGYRAARQCSVNSAGEFCYPFEKTWFSMWDQSIFLWPPPPKGWGVVIEWKGIKYQWGADDIVPFSGQVMDLLRLWFLWRDLVTSGCRAQQLADLKALYDNEFADVMYRGNQMDHAEPNRPYPIDVLTNWWCSCGAATALPTVRVVNTGNLP